MTELRTCTVSPWRHLPADRRDTMTTLHKAIRKAVPKLAPFMTCGMGPSPIIGYGKYHYKSASGRESDWFTIGLVAGRSGYALHLCVGGEGGYLVERNAAKLGKVKTGRSCINFKKLEDLKLNVVLALVRQAAKSGGHQRRGVMDSRSGLFMARARPNLAAGAPTNMRPFLLLCILVTVFFCFVRHSLLNQREADLAAARVMIRATEETRVPREDFDSKQNALFEAEKKLQAMQDELKQAQGQVTALSERVTAMENQPKFPAPGTPGPAAKAGLIKGGYTLLEENRVYLPDAQFRLGDHLSVSSPQGIMMSDPDQTIFGGDLLLQTPQGTIQGDDAVLEVNGDDAVLTAKQVKVTLRKSMDAANLDQPAPSAVR